ncbi:MAG: nuclear transport factor 2 family protein [Alphaproteobacteria bacterium]|nr:nuclear transport factor 2 family protein [Alphaproteobacteria bacterium]
MHMQTMETMVLQREGGTWKITHIHWSSSPVTDDHSH